MSAADRVVVYYLHPGENKGRFTQSLFEMGIYDVLHSRRLDGVVSVRSGATIAASRNGCVTQFLDRSEADWVLFIDSDMVFDGKDGRAGRDVIDHMFKHADAESCPILGGLCFGLDDIEGPFPTLYKLVNTPDGPMTGRFGTLPAKAGIVDVDATGAAFLMIHRGVLEAMREREFSKAYPWFQESELGGGYPVGEDITFCLRARALGYKIRVDMDVLIGHDKGQVIGSDSLVKELTER